MILHVDADAFFASVIQAVHPHLRGKPIATGKERGVAIAVSYEAQRYGVKRCMTTWEIEKICPQCIMVDSEFEMYHLFSSRMFQILRTFSPIVEEYSIDEAFVDITDLPAMHKKSYYEVAKIIKERIESSLGITVSVGVAPTKSLAKIASSWKKPSGLVVMEPGKTSDYLKKLPVIKIWGIGLQISRRLNQLGIYTAFEYISQSEGFIKQHLSKPYLEIWRELRGQIVYEIDPTEKTTYQSISKVQTFTPPTPNPRILWARLLSRIESAFEKARLYHYDVGKIGIYLKTQEFRYHSVEIKLPEKTALPFMIRDTLRKGFSQVFKKDVLYRATGCVLSDFDTNNTYQYSLFNTDHRLEDKIKKIYPLYEQGLVRFGTSLFDQKKAEQKEETKFKIPLLSLKF